MAEQRYLDKLYGKCDNHAQTMAVYDEWAETYDQEIAANGYVTPERCANALAQYTSNLQARTLDMGCGTGIGGLALRMAGFSNLDGSDMSSAMLEKARAREGVYQELRLVSIQDPFPFPRGIYAQIAAIGVIVLHHAPPETIAAVLDKLDTGGLFVFSLNDHTLSEPAYPKALQQAHDQGMCETVFDQHGEHLPGFGLGARVYVLRRL